MLGVREKTLGSNHTEVASSLNNLAVLLKTTGALDEAEVLYARSIRIKEARLGITHPQVDLFCKIATFLPLWSRNRCSQPGRMCKISWTRELMIVTA